MKEYLRSFLDRFDYTKAEKEYFLGLLDRILAVPQAYEAFRGTLSLYSDEDNAFFSRMLDETSCLAEEHSLPLYGVHFLLIALMSEKLLGFYKKKGLSEAFFTETMKDLLYKCRECELVKGEPGTFVAPWYLDFFRLRLFSFGRLECQLAEERFPEVPSGFPAVNVHIPRDGTRLLPEEVLKSLRKAREFFSPGRPLVFQCHSWLLYDRTLGFLSPESNIRAFASLFHVSRNIDDRDYSEVWRLFDREYDGNPDHLPADSSLRRKYIGAMKRKEPFGSGCGWFLLK